MDQTDKRSMWHTIEGVALIALGLFAILLPVFTGAALAEILGIVLVAAGVVGLIAAFQGHRHQHRGWAVASSLLAILIGLTLIFEPVLGAGVLALVLAFYLLMDGVMQIGLARDHRRRGDRAAGWLLALGILDIVLALVIAIAGPLGKAAFIGFIVGIDLILAGTAMLALHRPWPAFPRATAP